MEAVLPAVASLREPARDRIGLHAISLLEE